MKWQVLKSKTILKGNYLKVHRNTCKLPDKHVIDFFLVEIPNWITVVTFTPEKKIILVKQYRPAMRTEMIQLPGGYIKPKEDPRKAIKREILEETGYKLKNLKLLGTWAVMASKSTTKMTAYIAQAVKTKEQKLDIEEQGLHTIEKTPQQVIKMIKNGQIWSAPHIAAILTAKEKYPHLFKKL